MNAHLHKVIFNARLGALVAVGENASALGKSASGESTRSAVFAAAVLVGSLNSAFALDPSTLPAGHQVAAGQVQVTSSGAQMDIQQSSNKAILNWQSFDVGSSAKVNIVQPNSAAALLNRVVGNNPSQIHGQINANGQVVLVNPNGVLVGSSGAITASAFTATTFGITDANFESGNMTFTRNGSNASVDNQGSINTSGGYVALIGASVSNSGTISTGGGNALLGAGDAVSIPLAGNIRLELDPAAFASVDNSGTITTNGGQVFMRASAVVDAVSKVANATVTHSGTINTSGGRVDILADHGTVRVSGAINAGGASVFIGRDEQTNVLAAVGDASGAQLESQGGFVETSGQFLKVDGARVIAKDWLLDPFNITIVGAGTTTAGATGLPDYTPNASSTILASDITTNLNAGTNVTISTAGAGGDEGNISVNADIVKTSTGTASLTLIADNNITVNNKIAAESFATGLNVTLRAGQTTNAGRIHLTNTSLINAEAGDVILQTQGGAIFNALNATISGKNVTIDNTGGAIAADGSVTAGSGTNAANESAITIIANITATDNLNLQGRSVSHNGIVLGGNRTLSGGRIQAVGQTGAGGHVFNSYGVLIQSGARVVTTGSSGDSVIKGIRQSQSNIGGQGALQTQAASVEAALGTTLTLEGHAIGSGLASHPTNSRGIRIEGLLRTRGDIRLLGTSVANDGVLIIAPLAVETGSLNINGTMTALGGGGRSGVGLEAAHNITLSQGTSLTIVGHAANTGTATSAELGVTLSGSILQAAGATAGDISITGSATSTPSSFGVIVNGSITTGGNIHIQSVVGRTEQTAASTISTSGVGATINIDSAQSLVAAGTIGIVGTGNLFAHSSAGTINIANAAVTGNMAATAAGNISIVNTGATKFSARTTANNGSITLVNSGGTLDVAAVNGLTGVVTHGSGNIALTSSSTSGYGMILRNSVTAANGNVTLSGSTSTTQTQDIPFAGVYGFSSVTGNNITLSANATGASGTVLGYYGAGGVFEAKGSLSLTGTSNNTGNGLYTFGGRYASATGMTLVGTSASGQGMNFDRNLVIVNGSSGGIDISASAGGATPNAISMRGVSITNGGGDITLDATQGHIFADSGNLDWGLGALSNTFQQSGTGQVLLTTVGDGNITVPTIVNNSAGQVVIAAGSNLAAGTASGGQVLTVSGNAITQNSGGKTFIYSGQASGTGQLSFLHQSFNQLVSNGTSLPINTQFNTAYAATIASGPDHQVLFRSATGPSFTLGLNHVSATYGDAERNQAALNSALLSAYTGPSLLSTVATGANGGVNTFAVTASDVIAGLTGTARAAGNNAGTYAYTNVSASAFNTVLSAQPNLVINPRSIALTSLTSAQKIYDGNTVATINGATFSGLLTGEALSMSGSGYFNSANVNGVSTFTVDDVTKLTKVNGTGLWSNYSLTTTGAITQGAVGQITPKTLTATVNDSAVFVTQLSSQAPDMGVSYSGFVGGDSASTAIGGSFTRTYSGSSSYLAPGDYADVFDLSATPTALNGNYTITVVKGSLSVVRADKLLVNIQSQSAEYGQQSRTSNGIAAGGTVSAVYCLDATDCNGANLSHLVTTRLSDHQWKATDNTGDFVVFDTSLISPTFSSGDLLNAGSYRFTATEITPLSSFTNGVANFNGRHVNGGTLSVTPMTLAPTSTAANKNFDGTTSATATSSVTGLAGDSVTMNHTSARFDTAAAGTNKTVTLSGLSLSGADADNYRLSVNSTNTFANIFATTSTASLTTFNASVVQTATTTTTTTSLNPLIPAIKPMLPSADPGLGATSASGNNNAQSTLDNPFQLSTDGQNLCNDENLEACGCDTTGPEGGLDICYQRLVSSP